ncbi:MAG: DegT/DnrJ/EryC1/StrS family aminotransferase [Planctomycetota bacterium]|nr:DegT/DnrJ/EryC1/StrS family aminotransferase [Planctomycetota bacterium]
MKPTRRSETLAALGGDPVIPKGALKPWPPVGALDRKMVLASLEGGQHTYGPNCTALEKEFSDWSGLKHTLFCNSGTAALHMALVACQCGAGDEVLAPAYTWPSSATCCLHHNIIPVFVDIEWSTMNIDPDKIEAAITPRTKAIIVVHLHGLTVNMKKVLAVARRHGLKVIEDCCQAHGAAFGGRPAGTFGDVAAFSTNQNKIMCSGEGGFFSTNDPATFERGKTLWYFGENRPPDAAAGYHAYGMGWMYRSSDLVAAFARAQLTRLDANLAKIHANAARLTECLADVPHLILPTTPRGHRHNFYNYTVRFDMAAMNRADQARAFRDKLVVALRAEGVETGVWQGWPVPEMTALQAKDAYGRGCPWSCRHAAPVDYSLDQYPVARRHCDWHTGMTTPLRPPNGPRMAQLVARAFGKVMTHLDQVDQIK